MGRDKALLLRDRAHLRLGQSAERQIYMRKLLCRQHVKHIALILGGIGAAHQTRACGRLHDLRIMSGHERITAELRGTFQQLRKFQMPVAFDAGVRRPAAEIAVHKAADDLFSEQLRQVKHTERNPEALRDGARVRGIVRQTAFAVQPHRAADAGIPRLHGQIGCHTGIHAAAHGDQCFFHISSVSALPALFFTASLL